MPLVSVPVSTVDSEEVQRDSTGSNMLVTRQDQLYRYTFIGKSIYKNAYPGVIGSVVRMPLRRHQEYTESLKMYTRRFSLDKQNPSVGS